MRRELDYNVLESEVLRATKSVIMRLQHAIGAEILYVFGLFYNEEMSYVYATANTEEGLTERTYEYLRSRMDSFEDMRLRLRWSPADWKYHLFAEDAYVDANAILELGWNEDFSEYTIDKQRLLDIYENVLRKIDAEGLFGDREEKNLLLGCFEPEINISKLMHTVKRLNPPLVYARFVAELDAFQRLLP